MDENSFVGRPRGRQRNTSKRIVAKYGLLHLSSGDILRQERAASTELGKKAQSYMDSGALVPDEIIVEMMVDAIKKTPETGFVLDGFPRTVNQAQELDKALFSAGQKIDTVLNLKVDHEVVARRMTGRKSCPQCGAVYHIKTLKPRVEGICDNDGAKLIQRPDDGLEVVANRLKTYQKQTEPVVVYYKKNNTVCGIDANRDADEVTDLIFENLDALIKA